MKKNFIAVLLFSFLCLGFAKELDGKNLEAVNKVSDGRFYISRYEGLEAQLAYLKELENQIAEMGDVISDEAKLICKSNLSAQVSSVILADEFEKIKDDPKKKRERRHEKDPEAEKLVMDAFNEYAEFEAAHPNLSAHFYYNYKAIEMATLPYLSTDKQIKMLTNILDDYRKIEEMNPNYSENLFTLAAVLYMVPKVAGGNKEEALEKLKQAINSATCVYEKSSSLVLYSQLLFEEKQVDKAAKYFEEALKMDPENKTMLHIKEMNDAGFSMFQEKEYNRKIGKQ